MLKLPRWTQHQLLLCYTCLLQWRLLSAQLAERFSQTLESQERLREGVTVYIDYQSASRQRKLIRLRLHNISKIYLSINTCNKHIAENCFNGSRLYSMYHLFTLCVTIYLAKSDEVLLPSMVTTLEMSADKAVTFCTCYKTEVGSLSIQQL